MSLLLIVKRSFTNHRIKKMSQVLINKFNYKCKAKEKFINAKLQSGLNHSEASGLLFHGSVPKLDETGVKRKSCSYRQGYVTLKIMKWVCMEWLS